MHILFEFYFSEGTLPTNQFSIILLYVVEYCGLP